MSNLFRQLGDKLRRHPTIVPFFLVFVVMLVVGVVAGIEDYFTSLLGYEMLPTNKANEWVIPIMALLPQVGQLGMAFAYAQDVRRRWALAAWLAFHAWDVSTDMYFKVPYWHPGIVLLAFVETELLYTLGSEWLVIFSFGMLLDLAPDVIARLGRLSAWLSGLGQGQPSLPPKAPAPPHPAQNPPSLPPGLFPPRGNQKRR